MNENTKMQIFVATSILVLGSGLGLLFANQKSKNVVSAAEVQSRNVYPNTSVAVSATATVSAAVSVATPESFPIDPIQTAIDEATTETKYADEFVSTKDWIDADDHYSKAIDKWQLVPDTNSSKKSSITNLKKKQAKIAYNVKLQLKKIEKEKEAALAAEAYKTICGDRPVRSNWDGEYFEVTAAMKKVAHDPSSIDVENCTFTVMSKDNCWTTSCVVRGKNMYGAMIMQHKKFSISRLGVSEIEE